MSEQEGIFKISMEMERNHRDEQVVQDQTAS